MYDTRNKPWTVCSPTISPPSPILHLVASICLRYFRKDVVSLADCFVGERDRAKPRRIWPAISFTQDILSLFIQEEELHYNVTAGIVLSDHSLVLQSITRESAGRYTCTAVNVEGRASSNVVNLEVMCEYILLLSSASKKQSEKRKKKKKGRVLWLAKVGDKNSTGVHLSLILGSLASKFTKGLLLSSPGDVNACRPCSFTNAAWNTYFTPRWSFVFILLTLSRRTAPLGAQL